MKFFIIAVCLAAVSIAWCFFSRRHSTPCSTGLSWLIERDNPFSTIHRAATIVENARIQPNLTVLDAGCGPGRITIPAAFKVGSLGKIVAMDIQAGMLSQTQRKAQAANLTNISFFHAGLGEKKLEQETFDRVLLVTVLGEIPDREAALKEIFGALKPNGILSVTEIISDTDFQRRATVVQLANKAGFREIERFGNCFAFTINFEKIQLDSSQKF